jgi:hypothetical protein
MSKAPPLNNPDKIYSKPRESAKLSLTLWPIAASLSILTYGLYRAIDLRWICDDAFITMRYVKNFVEGNGLVYNIGERVEGYTHFLWLMLVAAANAIGFDSVDSSIWLGIASYTGILVLLLAISFCEHKKNPKVLWLPLAAAMYAFNYDTTVWASGGLETSFYAFLILLSFYIWFYSGWTERLRLLLTGITLALVSLTRPDGALFALTAAVLLIVNGIRRKQSALDISKTIGILILPSVAIGVPYLIWKYLYYGAVLPLTYYAKSGDKGDFSQGLFYIWLYFRVHFTPAIALIAGGLLLLLKKHNIAEQSGGRHPGSPSFAAVTIIVVYLLLFVARVGGDFMFARFIIPAIPFVCFLIERIVDRLLPPLIKYRVAIMLALFASLLLENKLRDRVLFHSGENFTRGIADERWAYYTSWRLAKGGESFGQLDTYSKIGKYLEPFFRGLPVTVAIPGAANMVAYYANFSTSINEFGLTDRYIAHLPITVRGRIGHEKQAPESYLMDRNVDFELGRIISDLPKQTNPDILLFYIPQLGVWESARIVKYDKSLMNELSRRFTAASGQSIVPLYEKTIPDYADNVMPDCSLVQLESDFVGFQTVYFSQYPDTALEHRFEERIAELKLDSAK